MAAAKYITIDGETHNKSEWYRIYNIDSSTIQNRVKHGMTFEQALKMEKRFERTPPTPKREGKKAPKKLHRGYEAKNDKKCRKCKFGERSDSRYVCMYAWFEKKRRGCEAGDKCTKSEPRSRRITEAQKALFKVGIYGGKEQ